MRWIQTRPPACVAPYPLFGTWKPKCSQPSRMYGRLIWCLGLLTVLSAVWPVYRAFLRVEIDFNEGWNAYHADAAMAQWAVALYLDPSNGQVRDHLKNFGTPAQ